MRLVDKKILVVDDQADQRLLLRRILESAGSIVIEAGSVKEALSQLTQNSPDLIILDWLFRG